MRGLVAAGGHGTRLRPLTYTSAKQLMPVANKPIIFYVLEDLAAAGITDVCVVIAPETGEEIRTALGSGERFGLDLTFIVQDAPRGIADVVRTAETYLRGEPFVLYLGDNLLQQGATSLVEEFDRVHPNASILLAHVPNPTMFGVAELDGDRVVRLIEKPKEPPSDLALVGVYLFDEHIYEAIASIEPSWRGELEITDAIQWLIDRGLTVLPHVVQGWWLDTGKKDDMLAANSTILDTLQTRVDGEVDETSTIEGRVVVEAGAKVVRSRIRGPVIVGAGAQVVGSYIGPCTAIGEGCEVVDSEVENSILRSESRLVGVRRLVDSILGRGAEVGRDTSSPVAYRLMVGDHSQVGLP
jgi:glucose-1-phosphate thymidylyltransferase